MRELTNLSWPDTPYGADKRPVARTVHLLTGMAVQCADNGTDTVPVSAAAVFLPIHRTRELTVVPSTLHFGFRIALAEPDTDEDTTALLRFVDRILVQGRRHAAALAWHSYADDWHVMRGLATERLPGVSAVGEAWAGRAGGRERGTAPLIDTAEDLDGGGLIAEAAELHGIELGGWLRTQQRPATTQGLYDALTDPQSNPDTVAAAMAAGALTQALAVALLGGKASGALTWEALFDLEEAIRLEAWHAIGIGPVLDPAPDTAR